ncbi:MAG: hypothetical protein ACD_62C00645G0001, partial [uncultured bacterium]
GGLIGAELGMAASGHYFNTGMQSCFGQWMDNPNATVGDLVETYGKQWVISFATQFIFMGAGRIIGAQATAWTGSTNVVKQTIGRIMVKFGAPIDKLLRVNQTGHAGLQGYVKELLSENIQELIEQSLQGVNGPLGTLLGTLGTLINCVSGRVNVPGMTLAGGFKVGDNITTLLYEFVPGSEQDVLAWANAFETGAPVTRTITQNVDGSIQANLTQDNGQVLTLLLRPSQIPVEVRQALEDQGSLEAIGISYDANNRVYRSQAGADPQALITELRNMGLSTVLDEDSAHPHLIATGLVGGREVELVILLETAVAVTEDSGQQLEPASDETSEATTQAEETDLAQGVDAEEYIFSTETEAFVAASARTRATGQECLIYHTKSVEDGTDSYWIKPGTLSSVTLDPFNDSLTGALQDQHFNFFGYPIAHTHPSGEIVPSTKDFLDLARLAYHSKKSCRHAIVVTTAEGTRQFDFEVVYENDRVRIVYDEALASTLTDEQRTSLERRAEFIERVVNRRIESNTFDSDVVLQAAEGDNVLSAESLKATLGKLLGDITKLLAEQSGNQDFLQLQKTCDALSSDLSDEQLITDEMLLELASEEVARLEESVEQRVKKHQAQARAKAAKTRTELCAVEAKRVILEGLQTKGLLTADDVAILISDMEQDNEYVRKLQETIQRLEAVNKGETDEKNKRRGLDKIEYMRAQLGEVETLIRRKWDAITVDSNRRECGRAVRRARVNNVLRGRNLPIYGPWTFIPPDGWQPTQPLPQGRSGFIDARGNEWQEDLGARAQGNDHWDVSFEPGMAWGVRFPGVRHANINFNGFINH